MKVALGQINCHAKDIDVNFKQMEEMIVQAVENNMDLIVFPELALTGFACMDLFFNQEWLSDLETYHQQLLKLSNNICIVWGSVSMDNENTYYLAHQGQLVLSGSKEILNNRYIPETRYFNYYPQEKEFYELECDGKVEKISISFLRDTEILPEVTCHIIIDNSPWEMHYDLAKDILLKELSQSVETLIYVNAVGAQNTGKHLWVLDGGSRLYHKALVKKHCNSNFEVEYLAEEDVNTQAPCSKLLMALITGIKEFDKQVFPFQPKWLIGLSGGLDSSINAALLVLALGKERVIAYNMATSYNSTTTVNNAQTQAKLMGIEFHEGSIENLVAASKDLLVNFDYSKQYHSLVYENIQARLRGHALGTFASVTGGVIINNGNKIEGLLGYYTMYGDSIGALCSLGDLTKMQLFELGKMINDYCQAPWISENLLPVINDYSFTWETKPSAELTSNQEDPMKWGYHDILLEWLLESNVEEILESYLNDSIYDYEIGKWLKCYGLNKPQAFITDLEWIISTINKNVFKRIQLPPVIAISGLVVGIDYLENQGPLVKTQRYEELKMAILAK